MLTMMSGLKTAANRAPFLIKVIFKQPLLAGSGGRVYNTKIPRAAISSEEFPRSYCG